MSSERITLTIHLILLVSWNAWRFTSVPVVVVLMCWCAVILFVTFVHYILHHNGAECCRFLNTEGPFKTFSMCDVRIIPYQNCYM
jgi:hypothetical protein